MRSRRHAGLDLRGRFEPQGGWPRIEAQRLHQLVNDLGRAPGLHGLGDAGLEVVAQHQTVRALDRALHSGELLHHLRAVHLVINHADHSVEVAPSVLQSAEDGDLVPWLHGLTLPTRGGFSTSRWLTGRVSAVGGLRPWSHGLASSALTTAIVVVDVGLSRIAWRHGAGVGWLAYVLLVAVAVVFALGTLYTWRAGQPMPLPVLCVSGVLLMALVADVLSLAVAGRGTGTSAVHAASAGTALTLLTAAGVSVVLYLLALRHLSGPVPLHTAETGGRGPAVVFVHGLGASGRYWDAVVPRLAGRRTVAVDLLGFGRSPKPRRASYDVDCHTDGLAPHVPEGSIVVAHSVGASVALRLATHHSARVAGLVLIAPPAHADAETARDQISELGTLARLTTRDRLAAMTMCELMCMLRPFAAAVAPPSSGATCPPRWRWTASSTRGPRTPGPSSGSSSIIGLMTTSPCSGSPCWCWPEATTR